MADTEGTAAAEAGEVTVEQAAASLAASDASTETPIEEPTEPSSEPIEATISYDAVGRPYVAPDPVADAAAAEAVAPTEAALEIPDGYVALVYRGIHDSFEYGPHQFRPGKPVAVPSEAAEELLTYPFEPFERA